MRLEDVVRYCGYCGLSFAEGDDLSMVMLGNGHDPDPTHVKQAAITIHRDCAIEIQEMVHDEAVASEL